MVHREPYSGDLKLILGFDIGTTFSRISYCILEQRRVPEILGVTRFPSWTRRQGDPGAVPSLLYYDENGHYRAAGFEVLADSVVETALNEGWTRAERWKLHLHPKHHASSIDKGDHLPPLPPEKTAVHVLADFICYLSKCTKTYIEERHLGFSWPSVEDSVEYTFTHPNGWKDIEQQYRRAIELAGLVPSTPEGQSRIRLLTKGEACLHFGVANLNNANLTNQPIPHGVVIIYAGHETIDLSMFSMTTNPISCKEMVPAECRLVGSKFVTRQARVLMERKLRGWEHSTPDEIAEYTREFEQSTQLVIQSDLEPAYVRVGGRRTNVPKYNISFGKLKFSGEEATGIFNDSIDAIIGAFEQQQQAAEMRITLALFVGSLSENEWMWSRLQTYFRTRNICIFRPDGYREVDNGAVLSHIYREKPKSIAGLRRCERLFAAGRPEDLVELLEGFDTFASEMNETVWAMGKYRHLKSRCFSKLEVLGDEALRSGKHGEAIARYSSALSLKSSNQIELLVKRCQAQAANGLWRDALADADEVIKLDPLSHLGYERKSLAHYGEGDYAEVVNVLLRMLSIVEKSPDEEIRRIGKNYVNPLEAIRIIESAVQKIFRNCPLVLIDLGTGKLWDEHERIQAFKSDMAFKKLVADVAIMKIDRPHVHRAVADYFKWVMFSHTWEGKEPTFQDVSVVDSIWNLDSSPLNEKLHQFCTTSRKDGYRWAWSDTCCIDKSTSTILSQSITSMYRWYAEAAETLVYLADVLSPARPGDLTKSRWMTRAWALQELLASKVVRFYTRDWKLYLNDTHHNHKESSLIKHELAQAIGIIPKTLTSFHPDDLGVREKLRLASNRNATKEEDIAYSLIGIFSSDIRVQYGLGETALGELLENVVARTGDVTVIAWVGKSLSFNSALPESLAVYCQTPYSPPPVEADELDKKMDQLRSRSETQRKDIVTFYDKVIQLPRATFSHRCLQLPCITFYVEKLGVQDLDAARGNLYCALVSVLGRVEFRTVDVMPLRKPRKLVLIHPWFRDLCYHLDEFASDNEEEVESEDEPDGERNSGVGSTDDSDDSVPVSPLHAKPLAPVDRREEALRLIAQLGRPFSALLLMKQQNGSGQYKRVATEYEIIAPGVPPKTNVKDLRAKVLEIV